MATVIPKRGQIVLTKEAFDAKAAAGQLIPGAEYLISDIQYVTTTEADMILQSAKDYTDVEANKKVDKTSVSESVVANSVVKRTVDGDILVNDDNTAMASKPSNIAVSKGYVQYIMTTLSELFGQNLEAVISSISSSASTDGYTQTLTFKNVNDTGIGTLDIVMPKTNLEITEDSSLFKYTFTLKDSKGNTLSTKTIDLPLEELVVNGSYNNVTKSIVLTLKNGNTVDIPVGDLVEGLVNSTDLQNALDNYATLEQVNAKYTKPSTGIPKTDLESSVQSSLNKADTALQEHQDISGKVDKVEGKGLSTNDYTNTDKAKLDGLANIKTIGDNLTLDGQGKLSAKTASGVSSINGQTGAVTGIATTEEVNDAKQSANSYTDTKTGEISTALQQNTTKVNELEQQNASQSSQIESLGQTDQSLQSQIEALTNASNFTSLWSGNWTNSNSTAKSIDFTGYKYIIAKGVVGQPFTVLMEVADLTYGFTVFSPNNSNAIFAFSLKVTQNSIAWGTAGTYSNGVFQDRTNTGYYNIWEILGVK